MDCPDRDESSLALSGQRWVKPSAVDRDESSLALSGEQWVMLRAFRDKHWAKLSSERDLQRWSLALSKKKCSLIGPALSHNFLFCFFKFFIFYKRSSKKWLRYYGWKTAERRTGQRSVREMSMLLQAKKPPKGAGGKFLEYLYNSQCIHFTPSFRAPLN